MSPRAPTAVIADDHQVTRIGVRMAIVAGGFDVVGEASDRRGAVAAVLAHGPDLCLMDLSMPGGGIGAAREIAASGVATAIVMLTVSTSPHDMREALGAGAVGYLPKDMRPERLTAALLGVLNGEAAIPRTLVSTLLPRLRELDGAPARPMNVGKVHLTPREAEILKLLRGGFSTRQISEMLVLSPVTVRRHISGGVLKLGVSDRAAAVEAIDMRVSA